MSKKRFAGIVVSNAMNKTVVVKVERLKRHPRYLRTIRMHKNYKAHDENKKYKVGDKVIIEECRPLSKEKHWRVIGVIKSKGYDSDTNNVESSR